MSDLSDLQHAFSRYLLEGKEDAITGIVATPPKGNKADRLFIYSNAYRVRLLEILDAYFPILLAWIGQTQFRELCEAYLQRHPSNTFSVRYLGKDFADFIATDSKHASALAWSEMARLEYAIEDALDATDAPPLALTDLMQIDGNDWPEAIFHLHPSVQLLHLKSNVPTLREAMLREETPPECTVTDEPSPWAVWRQDQEAYFFSLSEAQAWLMQAIDSGVNFTELAAGLCAYCEADQAVVELAESIQAWTQLGLLRQGSADVADTRECAEHSESEIT